MKFPDPPQEFSYPAPRRNKFEIWCEVLEYCLKIPRTQTWLLHELRLKTSVIKDALSFLQNVNLLTNHPESDTNKMYVTTQKGEKVLNTYYGLISLIFNIEKSKKKSE